jgi:peptide deformylase
MQSKYMENILLSTDTEERTAADRTTVTCEPKKSELPPLTIIPHGHKILEMYCREVIVPSADLIPLVDQMISYCKIHPHAVGLAAPQIGRLERFFVMRIDDKDTFIGVINPRVHAAHTAASPFLEGCLSIPGFETTVWRYDDIDVSYVDAHTGLSVHRRMTGLYARIFQHELDHLDGIQITDEASKSDLRRGRDAIKACLKRAAKMQRVS